MDSSQLALGTVQFGMAYGVANVRGQVGLEDATKILQRAFAAGIDTLDTAIAYGESESSLGKIGVGSWQVVSKLPRIPDDCADVPKWVRQAVLASLARLQIPRLRALLLHAPDQLLGPRGAALHEALDCLKRDKLVDKIGISIYSPGELDELIPTSQIDLVQAPFSVIDRRLATSGWLTQLRAANIEVHVRSVFLQGLLLMSGTQRPVAFSRWQALWERWHSWLAEVNLSPLAACLAFAGSQPGIDRVVVGVDSLAQLEEILEAASMRSVAPPAALASDDPDLVNPSRWKLA